LPKPNDGTWYTPTKGGNREEPGYYATGQLSDLKQFEPRRHLRIPADQYVAEYSRETGREWPAVYYKSDETVATTAAWPEAKARVDELISAIEAWRKACRRINHECGYMKAEREFQRLANKDSALLDKICNVEAKTMQGILVKARAVKHLHMDNDAIEFGHTTDAVLAASILNELLALAA
jgi:hypothetical protein